MPQELDRQQDLVAYAATSPRDVDLTSLVAVVDEARRSVAADQPRIAVDQAMLAWLMGGEWYAIVIADGTHPVGFQIAMPRTLLCRGQPLRVWYLDLLAVAAECRGRGIAQWIMNLMAHSISDGDRADLVFGTYDSERGGLAAAAASLRRFQPTWSMQYLHRTRVWTRLLTAAPAVNGRGVTGRRLWRDGGRRLMVEASGPGAGEAGRTEPPSEATIAAAYDLAFGLGDSFQAHYLQRGSLGSGALWYPSDDGSCLVTYRLAPISAGMWHVGTVGQIQAVYAGGRGPTDFHAILNDLTRRFQGLGCFSMSIVDAGVIPTAVLQSAGFRPSTAEAVFAVKGPTTVLSCFGAVAPPFFLDAI